LLVVAATCSDASALDGRAKGRGKR